MRTWCMDGTFKVVPQWYQQLFTIHAFVAGKLVPAIYCLCTGKDIGTYGFIFQALINKAAVLGVNLNSQTIICDFETALIPAIQGYFLNTRVQGRSVYNVNIRTNNHLEDPDSRTGCDGHPDSTGDLRLVLKTGKQGLYEKQQRVSQYTGEYTNGSRTLAQFLEALMYTTPEPI
ncbi:conserved hypothetical protein [Trichinella spiralis]|uniref:hypothetical protein n=1 Tax=Trichinella spiralis TaxID=6334 RepID=UPI0001EFD7B5|nr:conserved hypothetical protein [Trichinella spiralis]